MRPLPAPFRGNVRDGEEHGGLPLPRSLPQIELMRRKQSVTHLDQRLNIMLENAFYQVGVEPK